MVYARSHPGGASASEDLAAQPRLHVTEAGSAHERLRLRDEEPDLSYFRSESKEVL